MKRPAKARQPATVISKDALLDTLAKGDWAGFRAGLEALYAAVDRQTIIINIQN